MQQFPAIGFGCQLSACILSSCRQSINLYTKGTIHQFTIPKISSPQFLDFEIPGASRHFHTFGWSSHQSVCLLSFYSRYWSRERWYQWYLVAQAQISTWAVGVASSFLGDLKPHSSLIAASSSGDTAPCVETFFPVLLAFLSLSPAAPQPL